MTVYVLFIGQLVDLNDCFLRRQHVGLKIGLGRASG